MRPAASTSERRPRSAGQAALVALALTLASCRYGAAPVTTELRVFNSSARIAVRGVDADQARHAGEAAAAQLRRSEAEWRAWGDSDLARINAALRTGAPAAAPEDLRQLLRTGQEFARQSGGLLDPGVGGLVDLWGFHTSHYPVMTPPPTLAQIEQWRQSRPSVLDVRIDGDRLVSANPAVQLDFAAFAEGAAMREVAPILRIQGVHDALVDIGGDAAVLGDGVGAHPWPVAMPDPYGGDLGEVELGVGEAFFVSGNYNKFRDAGEGGRWGHILDPRTGMPAQGGAAAAVLDPDPVLADAASTALMVGGPAQFATLVRTMNVRCALMVTEENELLITTAMRSRLRLYRQPIPLGDPVPTGERCVR